MGRYRTTSSVFAILAVPFILASCGKKSSSTSDVVTGDPAAKVTASDAAQAYPQGLSLALLPEASGTTLEEGEEAAPTVKETQDQDKKFLQGKVASCISPNLLKAEKEEGSDNCYQFDQDMLLTNVVSATGPMPTGKMGATDGYDAAGKQACLVSFSKSKVKQIQDTVDRATGIVQTMLCQAKKADAGFELPAVGEKTDLKAVITSAFGGKMKKVESAELERLADVDGKPVFRSTVKVTDKNGYIRETKLTHSPTGETADGVGAYQGTLVMIGENGGAKKRLLTVRYLRATESSNVKLKYDLRMADVNKSIAEKVVDESGNLDLNYSNDANNEYVIDGTKAANANEALSSIRQISFDINPATNEGSFTYWENPGGNYNEQARGMIFAISKGADGKLGGCATTGAASSSIRKFLKDGTPELLTPKGTYHPFTGSDNFANCSWQTDEDGEYFVMTKNSNSQSCATPVGSPQAEIKVYRPNITDTELAKQFALKQHANAITRQCFVANDDGLFVIDTSKITESAGYEVVRTEGGSAAELAKQLPPPSLGAFAKLKPLNK